MNAGAGQSAAVVGRDEVRGRIVEALTGPTGAGSGTVVITGQAGVGKTVLARDAARTLAGARIFAGAGLPLSTVSVPFLLFRSMLRAEADTAGIDFDASASRVLIEIDRWADQLTSGSRVVLVVDDLQWVDPATLDVLFYLVAGPADRALSIIATVRDDQPEVSRLVDRWLLNVRRMPRCDTVALGPLDRVGTEEQIASLLGAPPHQSLVEDVWQHTQGSPYLTVLVVAGLDPNTRHLPEHMPDDLVDAVERSMHGLDRDAVTLLRVLAVGGVPMTCGQLWEVLVAGGATPAPDKAILDARLAQASRTGTIAADEDATYWFRHPLAAEILMSQLSEAERESWHAAFVAVGERSEPHTQGFEEIGRIADHAAASGDPNDAYRWSLIAARQTTDAGTNATALRFLERALSLRAAVPTAFESEYELLHAVRSAAFAGAAIEREVRAIDRLLAIVGQHDVLERSELTARRMLLQVALQRDDPTPAQIATMEALTAGHRGSWQHAYVLALAAMFTPEVDRAVAVVADSIECAERSGNDLAIAWSLAAGVDVATNAQDDVTALKLAPRAIAAALRVRDGLAYNIAATAAAVSAFGSDTTDFAESLNRRRLAVAGVLPHRYVSWLAMHEADCRFQVGDWAQCAAALRFTIGENPGPIVDMRVRALAGRLATRQGRFGDADGHFERFAELQAEAEGFFAEAYVGLAELLLERDDPLEAARTLASARERLMELDRPLFQFVVMRTLADARAKGSDAVVPAVETMIGELAFTLDHMKDPRWSDQRSPSGRTALALLHRAEMARAGGAADAPARWVEASDACGIVGWPWEEAYACRRAAEALLFAGRADRRAAAPLIRRGLDIALRLGAVALEHELRDLARFAHIPIGGEVAVDEAPVSVHASSIEGLTARESEIVTLVTAGRTYREIADELFVSEKTVSSHISNILRKTGAANRVDLARLASTVSSPSSG